MGEDDGWVADDDGGEEGKGKDEGLEGRRKTWDQRKQTNEETKRRTNERTRRRRRRRTIVYDATGRSTIDDLRSDERDHRSKRLG